MDCGICKGPCLLRAEEEPRHPFSWATHQRIIPWEEIERLEGWPFEIIGPDTLLVTWQYYHQQKKWGEADAVRERGKELGLTVGFASSRDHYVVIQNSNLLKTTVGSQGGI